MRFSLLLLLLVMTTALPAFGRTIRVPSEEPTIQAGIDASTDGDTVLVADGTYTGEGNRDIELFGKTIVLRSESGPKATVIDCEGDWYNQYLGIFLVYGETSDTRVEGFTVTNGFTYHCGGGINISGSSPVVSDCWIVGNSGDLYGGGIACGYASPLLTNCVISFNTNTNGHGGGVYCIESSPTIVNCIISHNHPCGNGSQGGGILCEYSSPVLLNCVIVENNAVTGAGMFCRESYPQVTNCIIWDNICENIRVLSGNPSISYSNIQDGWEGEGNIDLDPRFVPFPVRGYEYLLRPNSPCIDAGDPSIEDRLYDYHPRWPDWYHNGARSDMGVYGGPQNWKWLR